MIEQYLLNINKNNTVFILQKIELNKGYFSLLLVVLYYYLYREKNTKLVQAFNIIGYRSIFVCI